MSINSLQITNLRNIGQASLQFGQGLNLVHGDNGSGKSTLLEAIYLLARGRSYRTSRFGSVIRNGQSTTTLFARTNTNCSHRIGLQKTANKTRVKVDGDEVEKLSDIARITPLQIITPMSHEILERGPEFRRRFLEWGVFHVEHKHFPLYRQFTKSLRQRNMALRQHTGLIETWDHSLAQLGEKLNSFRQDYFNAMVEAFSIHAENLGLEIGVTFSWKAGWKEGFRYRDVLQKNLEQDIERGFTTSGPHRADFRVELEGRSAFNTASRGQQKMIIVCLHLAQASILLDRMAIAPIVLIDDLVSELDSKNRKRLVEHLDSLGLQVFITSTDPIAYDANRDSTRIRIVTGVPTLLG